MGTDSGRTTDTGGGRLGRGAALASVAAVLGISALVGRRNAPDATHPGVRRWYRKLDKPGFTPPDAAFGAVWPVLESVCPVLPMPAPCRPRCCRPGSGRRESWPTSLMGKRFSWSGHVAVGK